MNFEDIYSRNPTKTYMGYRSPKTNPRCVYYYGKSAIPTGRFPLEEPDRSENFEPKNGIPWYVPSTLYARKKRE